MTRKLVTAAFVAIMSFNSFALAADAGPQEVSGTNVFPVPHPQDPTICFQGVARRAYLISQGNYNDTFGTVFEVDKATWGGKFKLELTDGATGTEDMDIYFFSDIGTLGPDDPGMLTVAQSGVYQERKAGGEVGLVPPTSTFGITCLHDGFNASFTYTATPAKKKK
jgi:hypothetical protein